LLNSIGGTSEADLQPGTWSHAIGKPSFAHAFSSHSQPVFDGTVVWSGWKDNRGGFVVEILHPDGMRSTYNHNSKLTVGPGDTVAKGETVALVGSTGWSSGPHLDLRIWMYDRLVDPLRFY
jgi:murein DD-endopeptidase MepM/ murein hydrolase activator NlpD